MKRQQRPPLPQAAAVGDLLETLLRQQGLEEKLRQFRTWLLWEETVGPQIAARTRPVRIREGVLEVLVDHPVWMQQLQLLKPKILGRLNERLEGTEIRDLFLRRGRVQPTASGPAKGADEILWRKTHLSRQEEESIEAALAPLSDPDLRQRLRIVLTRQAQLAKARTEKADPAAGSPEKN